MIHNRNSLFVFASLCAQEISGFEFVAHQEAACKIRNFTTTHMFNVKTNRSFEIQISSVVQRSF